MRILHCILLLLMLLFMAVQYNDPDGALWVGIYSLPALFMVTAVVRPSIFLQRFGKIVLWVAIAVLFAGVVVFWPKTAGFWRQEIWWETESAREGMGMMIAFLVATSALLIRSKK